MSYGSGPLLRMMNPSLSFEENARNFRIYIK